jgi:glucose/arabinose dehydrogenase
MRITIERLVLAAAAVVLLAASPAGAQDPCDGVAPVTPTSLKSVTVATGLVAPVQVVSPPGDADRLFIVQQSGEILFHRRGDPPATLTQFLDITTVFFSGEAGLLSLAFDPNFATNRFFYVFYTESQGGNLSSLVSRFTVSALDPDQVVNNSKVELMKIRKPATSNHNGGQLLFGDDGFLYVFTGDGGGRDDEGTGHAACGNAQALNTLLGKVLRIDVGGVDPAGTAPDTTCMPNFTASTYTVPSSNPFSDGAGGNCNEIFALGLRNPWRASFDSANGDLYIGDVGQDCQDEIDRVTSAASSGANYAWRVMEGNLCFDPNPGTNCAALGVMCGSSPLCNDPGLTDPIHFYNHVGGCGAAVIGGFVYRGCLMPDLHGTYFYGDNCKGWVKSFELDGSGAAINHDDWKDELDPDGSFLFGISAFGVDEQQELYITDAGIGEVVKILPLFTDFQVSGAGSGSPLRLTGASGTWTWEDLESTSMHPVDYYRVYRGVPNGMFSCIHSTLVPEWIGGDPSDPAVGELFAYVVTAVSGGQETASGDPPQTLINPCPAP